MSQTGLYIHIPFCVSRCVYCNFCSQVSTDFDGYVRPLIADIKSIALKPFGKMQSGEEKPTIDTVYFGGGTPSLLPENCFERIFSAIKNSFAVNPNAEITVEVNPNSADKNKLSSLVSLGANRFSIGLQCADDGILASVSRPHNTDDFCRTVEDLHQLNQYNLSADVILGLPNQTLAHIEKTLSLLADYKINHVSAYALKVEKGTPLFRNRAKTVFPDDDTVADYYDYVADTLAKRSILRYEISNFASSGNECKHNEIYWHYGNYYAAGAAASGFVNGYRYTNYANIDKYIKSVNEGKRPCSAYRHTMKSAQMFEYSMLALRTSRGLNTEDFTKRFNEDFFAQFPACDKLLKQGFLKMENNVLTATNFNVLNSVLVELLF